MWISSVSQKRLQIEIVQNLSHPAHSVKTSALCVLSLSPALFSRCPSMLRGVNSRGVGVGGSTVVHGYRMCLGGYAAWLPSVSMSPSALLCPFLPLSLFLHIFCPSLSLAFLNPLSPFLSSFHSFSSPAFTVTAAAWGYQFIKERLRCAGISDKTRHWPWRTRPWNL